MIIPESVAFVKKTMINEPQADLLTWTSKTYLVVFSFLDTIVMVFWTSLLFNGINCPFSS